MALKGTLIWLCSLAAFASASQNETLAEQCVSQAQLLERLAAGFQQMEAECGESPATEWSGQQTAALLLSMRTVADTLHKHQQNECRGAEPSQCPDAEVPENGGLACVTIANRRYCKPLCNNGYDFGFIRRSRVYEECSEQTRYKWTTQYVGGNRLAVCNKESVPVAGAKTAYFPKDCLSTKKSSELQNNVKEVFTAELKSGDVGGEPQSVCLVCG